MDEEKYEEIVIKKYNKIENLNTIITVLSISLLPIIMIGYLIAEFNKLKGVLMILKVILLAVIIGLFVFFLFIRRCPNCRRRFDKYVVLPTHCPYCKIRLKK